MKLITLILFVSATLIGVFWFGQSKNTKSNERLNHSNSKGSEHSLMVYKSPTCGCCGNWVTYMRDKGYKVTVTDMDNMDEVKQQKNIPEEVKSCHTTIVNDDRYFIEGHIPEEAIAKLLEEEPNIKGIGLAGMPHASPGMPGTKMEPFRIKQIDLNSNVSEYMNI